MSNFATQLAALDKQRQEAEARMAQLADARAVEIGALAKKAGALSIPDEVILGALLAAVEGGDTVRREFAARAAKSFPKRGRKPNTPGAGQSAANAGAGAAENAKAPLGSGTPE